MTVIFPTLQDRAAAYQLLVAPQTPSPTGNFTSWHAGELRLESMATGCALDSACVIRWHGQRLRRLWHPPILLIQLYSKPDLSQTRDSSGDSLVLKEHEVGVTKHPKQRSAFPTGFIISRVHQAFRQFDQYATHRADIAALLFVRSPFLENLNSTL